MQPEPSKEEPKSRPVQGTLFSETELTEYRLPAQPSSSFRRSETTKEETPERRIRPARNQPLLPFHRNGRAEASKPTEAPAPTATRAKSQVGGIELRTRTPEQVASGEVTKARELLEAIRVVKRLEREARSAAGEERKALERFGGFGAVALSLFPDPIHRTYKSPSWESLGEELRSLLTEEEYASARRTVFNAFYTSPVVVEAMFEALERLGVPVNATVLEPGCGAGNFLKHAPQGMHFIGVELDSLSARVARALFPQHDIRQESFRDTRLPAAGVDAVIGNPPFADVKLEHRGERYSLHDYFFVKSLEGLKAGGILALVTSHFTLDKQNGAVRERLSELADFLGAIRLPSQAFAREGTKVVTDVLFLRRRGAGEEPRHIAASWLEVAPLAIEGVEVPINRYFHEQPAMVLGSWSRQDRLYSGEQGFSVSFDGDLRASLREAVAQLPELAPRVSEVTPVPPEPPFVPPPLERHITEGSFFIGEDRTTIYQVVDGRPEPVVYGGTKLKTTGTMTAKRLTALIRIRDEARRVLQSQNEGWPEEHRAEARRELNRLYDVFVTQYGLINKTTFSESARGTVIERMPNLVKFREDPDCNLVMALEECDPTSGTAVKAAIMVRDVVGRTPPVTTVTTAEEGLLVSLDRKGEVDLPFIASLYGAEESRIIEELGELIFCDPATRGWQTADEYLSGEVRQKLKVAEAAGAEFARNVEALQAVQPEDVLPGEIDANLGAPWIPEADIHAFAAELFGVSLTSISVAYLKRDALWSLEAGYDAVSSVPATSD